MKAVSDMNKIFKFQKNRNGRKNSIITLCAVVIAGLVSNIYYVNGADKKNEAQIIYANGSPAEHEANITGNVVVTDGDTLKINGIRIRLHGIDAPEIMQPCWREGVKYQCGLVAKNYLRHLVDNNIVKCRTIEEDKYGRNIAKCFNHENIDINAMMVSSGNAIAYLYYSSDYAKFQAEAKNNKRGIWSGRFTEPYRYRKMNL